MELLYSAVVLSYFWMFMYGTVVVKVCPYGNCLSGNDVCLRPGGGSVF